MKKFISILLFVTLIFAAAFAEVIDTDSVYESESTPKYISLGDVGYPIGKLLEMIGCGSIFYTGPDNTGEPVFENTAHEYLMEYQLEHGLSQSGCFDEETALYVTADSGLIIKELVWIPMHGGYKYHDTEDCSSMSEPREIPKSAAIALEFSYCKHCWRHGDPDFPQ